MDAMFHLSFLPVLPADWQLSITVVVFAAKKSAISLNLWAEDQSRFRVDIG
jgi:hypothetical protein